VLAGLGLVAGLVAWRLRRRRGVAIVLALAVGTLLAALVAWQLGELLGAGPTPDQLTDVGTEVVTPLRLSSMAALSVAPFLAVLGYVVSTLLTPAEDLDRPDHVCAAVQPADASLSREVGPVQGPAGPPQDPAASSRVAGGRGPSPSSRSAGR
jgi:hypothetical protein